MMHSIEIRGLRLAAQSFGNPADPALLLVMGATASMLDWPEALCDGLAARGLHVIRYDHRDTGLSTTFPPGAGGYAVEDLRDDLIAVLDGLGIARAHVAGMSLGGYLAQMAAVSHPGRVASLVLIASEPLGWDGAALPHMSDAVIAHFGALGALDWADPAAIRAFMLRLAELCAGRGAPFDALAAGRAIDAVLARSPAIASAFNHAWMTGHQDWSGAFRRIDQPVLVIHGADDPVLPLANGQALAAAIPGARIEVLAGVGHELPARILPLIEARIAGFLAALPA